MMQVGKGIYMDEIRAMINHKRRRLIANISDLHSFRDLGTRLLSFLFLTYFVVFLLTEIGENSPQLG
jgi:hypothetical protein